MLESSEQTRWNAKPAWLAHWMLLLFGLASAALLGSVVIPAMETGRILGLLREDEEVIEPARLAALRLTAAVDEATAERQRYDLARDSASLHRWRTAMLETDRELGELNRLAWSLGSTTAMTTTVLSLRVHRWRTIVDALPASAGSSTAADSIAIGESVRDSINATLLLIREQLGARAVDRREAIRQHENAGLLVNAVLVVAAVAMLGFVLVGIRRDWLRARRESALRGAAQAMAGTYTLEHLATVLAQSAMDVFDATGAYVAFIVGGDAQASIVIRGAAGTAVPRVGATLSLTDWVHHDALSRAGATQSNTDAENKCIIIPLGPSATPVGAIVVQSRRFTSEVLAWSKTFGDVAWLANEKNRLLEEAREGRRRLEQVMQSRSRLMRGFSHDVKNPLGAADGYAALLEEGVYGPVTDGQRAILDRMRRSMQRAMSLIEDLHELSRGETGHLSIRIAQTDITEVVRSLADEHHARAEAKGLPLQVDVEARLPLVETDAARVREIVANLVANAIKYTDRGGVTLRVHAVTHDRDSETDCVHIDIVDTGMGIPTDKQKAIFEEFVRLAPDREAGAGLGLAISKQVADALGCRLEVRSAVGAGSTFTLIIPVRRSGFDRGDETVHAAEVA